ncbi:hypothetical protein GN157_09325 [Flavobacterium rakeshii]|uniref:Lipoprotein n=1 Tax=Flavobacterium rakeshii TaxID=1038845 RepID=A0A6N8HE24_9FLAO|nr:hypothetical protein [Flavobacterium rakeshii]MUV03906.1 hypothetical protein [Flavobacterium rakeshii]
MKVIYIVLLFFFISCKENKPTETDKTTYYTTEAIKEKNEKEYQVKLKEFDDKDSGSTEPVLIPYIYDDQYYSNHNFIIDSLNHIYYFYQSRAYMPVYCGTGLDQGPYPAPFINLYPKDIIDIPVDDFETFFKSKVMDSLKPEERMYIYIGSQKDSFQSAEVNQIFKKLEGDEKNRRIICRRTTEEENIVLQYKKSGKPYNPDTIKWNPDLTDVPK